MIFTVEDYEDIKPKKSHKKPEKKTRRKAGEGRENLKPTPINEHTEMFRKVGRPGYWTEEKVKEEAEYLKQWAMKEDSLTMASCYGERYYSYHDAIEWEAKYEEFRQAKRFSATIINSRREKGALIGKLDSPLVRSTLGTYDLEHRAYLKEMKEASKEPLQEQDKEAFKEMMSKYMALALTMKPQSEALNKDENSKSAETKS